MTPQKQRIAIAEACGLTNVVPVVIRNVRHQGDDITVRISSDSGQVPDYIYDLNAMHDAEKVLTGEQVAAYVTTLYLEVQPKPMLHHATAAQRAEAFLRTIGKWEEAT
jgi:hypothetical protein